MVAKLLILGLAGALLYLNSVLWWSEDRGLPKLRGLEAAISAQQEENARLTERNQALEAEVLSLKEGLAAIEERARSELGLIRRGETFFHVMEEPAPLSRP